MLSRWIHYAWRHWEQLKSVPGISWQRIAASRTMMSIDQVLACKVLLPLCIQIFNILLCPKVPVRSMAELWPVYIALIPGDCNIPRQLLSSNDM